MSTFNFVLDCDDTFFAHSGQKSAGSEQNAIILNKGVAFVTKKIREQGNKVRLCSGNNFLNIEKMLSEFEIIVDEISAMVGSESWLWNGRQYEFNQNFVQEAGEGFVSEEILEFAHQFARERRFLVYPHFPFYNSILKASFHAIGFSADDFNLLSDEVVKKWGSAPLKTSEIKDQREIDFYAKGGYTPEQVLNCDFLPPKVGKKAFLEMRATEKTVAGGNAGNDIGLVESVKGLTNQPTVIVPANADVPLRAEIGKHAADRAFYSPTPCGGALIEWCISQGLVSEDAAELAEYQEWKVRYLANR